MEEGERRTRTIATLFPAFFEILTILGIVLVAASLSRSPPIPLFYPDTSVKGRKGMKQKLEIENVLEFHPFSVRVPLFGETHSAV